MGIRLIRGRGAIIKGLGLRTWVPSLPMPSPFLTVPDCCFSWNSSSTTSTGSTHGTGSTSSSTSATTSTTGTASATSVTSTTSTTSTCSTTGTTSHTSNTSNSSNTSNTSSISITSTILNVFRPQLMSCLRASGRPEACLVLSSVKSSIYT